MNTCGTVRAEQCDLLLSLDYRPTYEAVCWAAPRTPLIVWVHDPRPAEDIEKIKTLKVPGSEETVPRGIRTINCTSLRRIAGFSQVIARPVVFGAPAMCLVEKIPGTYGVKAPPVTFLPNIINEGPVRIEKHARPRVIFLGRLDPIKRPWIFAELAKEFPHIEFLFLGQAHFRTEGTWNPDNLPGNVRLMGHVDGEEKAQLLSSAWVLVNTSIHEALPISFLEALTHETPILSCQDPEGVATRFGVYVGRWDGTGLAGRAAFQQGLERLVEDASLRRRLGREGREWVRTNHSREGFLRGFKELCQRAKVLT